MTDGDDDEGCGSERGRWCRAALVALLVALIVAGGCKSGWRPPADLPVEWPR